MQFASMRTSAKQVDGAGPRVVSVFEGNAHVKRVVAIVEQRDFTLDVQRDMRVVVRQAKYANAPLDALQRREGEEGIPRLIGRLLQIGVVGGQQPGAAELVEGGGEPTEGVETGERERRQLAVGDRRELGAGRAVVTSRWPPRSDSPARRCPPSSVTRRSIGDRLSLPRRERHHRRQRGHAGQPDAEVSPRP